MQENQTKNTKPEQGAKPVKKRPVRYKLYDKIKVSLKTMDVLILVLIALLVLAVIAGILFN